MPFHGNWTNWKYKVAPVKCINSYTLVYFAAGNSIFQDLTILILPIPTLLGLNLGWQKKANLLVMFSLGIFVILCSILRLPSLIKLRTSTDPSCKIPCPFPFCPTQQDWPNFNRGRRPHRLLDPPRTKHRHNLRLPPPLPFPNQSHIPRPKNVLLQVLASHTSLQSFASIQGYRRWFIHGTSKPIW